MIKESNGAHKGETVYCTVNGLDCPYYNKGICYMEDPPYNCEDFKMFFETWEEWENA